MKKHAQVAKPLYQLILGKNVARKCNSVRWDPECQDAFDKLKELCTNTPILAYADFKKLFRLHTDASMLALESSYIKNKMELKRLLVLPVNHY